MCLFEKEESNTFSQGGTYDQYRRRIGNHPGFFWLRSLTAFVVWRGGGDRRIPAEARPPDQDQRGGTFCAAALRALRGDRFSRGLVRVCHQWGAHLRVVLRAAPALCHPVHGLVWA